MTAPRGISQPPTSFIGSQCQGIHHAPLNTYNTKTKNEFQKKLHTHTQNQPHPQKSDTTILRARCSQPLSTNQTPHPTTKAGQQHTPHPHQGRTAGLLSQSPIACLMIPQNSVPTPLLTFVVAPNPGHYNPTGSSRPHHPQWTVFIVVLLRKEVIQPHLPVRLPCYDFVPIADPTFDGSLHKG